MITSQKGIDLIKQFEPLRKQTYYLNNQWHIGYRHIQLNNQRTIITETQAERLLRADLVKIERDFQKIIKIPLKQQQFDALISFVFHEGIRKFSNSLLLQKINYQDFEGAANVLYSYRKILTFPFSIVDRRRLMERKLFES